jgi:hypothetical protein
VADSFEIRVQPAPEFKIERLGLRRYLLSVSGYLDPGWQSRLAAGLASSSLNIIEGFSASDGFGKWRGEFEFDRAEDVRDPEDLDFAELARSHQAVGETDVEIDEARLSESMQYGGSLMLTVCGHDSIGFLSRLLTACQNFGLYPVELRLRTRAGKIDDLMYLKDDKWAPPSPHAETALRQWLVERLRRSSRRPK